MATSRGWLVSLLVLQAIASNPVPELENANHIFNAVHSSGRQWGSSLHHNGMSFFIATVREGTQLYHGTSKPDRLNNTEWVAFDAEHAVMFAKGRPRPRPIVNYGRQNSAPTAFQHPLIDTDEQTGATVDEGSHGYLHAYRSKRNLRLLYIDGQSGAKSTKGTLDTQDLVLLHTNPPPRGGDNIPPPKDGTERPGGPLSESYRAVHLCEMAENEWDGRIDGFLRMELGFEIILCSFERTLDVDHIIQMKDPPDHGRADPHDHAEKASLWYAAAASTFDGIGGDRVRLHYDSFTTLFATPDAIYFDDKSLPRVRNDTAILRPVHRALREMILQEDNKQDQIDWQAVTDIFVARYSDPIAYLASGEVRDMDVLKAKINGLLRPYIDYSERNKTRESQRCAMQNIIGSSASPLPSLAETAVANVGIALCTALLDVTEAGSYVDAQQTLRELQSWLNWTTWKRCRGCEYHEFCFVPVWPMGDLRDYEKPRCVSNLSDTSNGYWMPQPSSIANARMLSSRSLPVF